MEDAAVGGGVIGSLDEAERALKQGDLRTAVRIAYRHLIERPSRDGCLKTELWKTSLTYLRECPQTAELFPLLQQTVYAYNAVVYGHLPLESREITRLLSDLRGRDTRK